MVSSIVIGNASIDVIEGFQDQPGGAVTYVSNALIKLDHKVRSISSFGSDYPKNVFDSKIKSDFRDSKETTKFKVNYKNSIRQMNVLSKGEKLSLGSLKISKISEDMIFFVPILDELEVSDSKYILEKNKNLFSVSIPQGWMRNLNNAKLINDFTILQNLPVFDLMFFSNEEIISANITKSELLNFAKILVITNGDKGSSIFTSRTSINISSYKSQVVDSIGAGDIYAAVFANIYYKTKNLEKAGDTASKISSKSTESIGLNSIKKIL